jgi:hypothetical protein
LKNIIFLGLNFRKRPSLICQHSTNHQGEHKIAFRNLSYEKAIQMLSLKKKDCTVAVVKFGDALCRDCYDLVYGTLKLDSESIQNQNSRVSSEKLVRNSKFY